MEVRFNDGWFNGRPNQWFFDRVNEMMLPHRSGANGTHEVPAADVIESEDGYHFYFEMPGVKSDTISVKVEEGTLTVEAERRQPEVSGKTTSHRSERSYRKYHRAFRLPEQYATQPVAANYKDGVLEIKIDKPAQAKPVQIKVNLN
ncbi:MAG TPA: Hsp20/alpha crystallin family protein [Candidatus Binataceae bacterium]|nr:Hsp20/alpha crystallin family protein [Candidatus Binataceae bacterium]